MCEFGTLMTIVNRDELDYLTVENLIESLSDIDSKENLQKYINRLLKLDYLKMVDGRCAINKQTLLENFNVCEPYEKIGEEKYNA